MASISPSSVNFHPSLPLITKFAVIEVGGITIGNDVYFRSFAGITFTDIAHELGHVAQYRLAAGRGPMFLGIAAFAALYYGAYNEQRRQGQAPDKAYFYNMYEVDARRVANTVR